MDEKIIFRGFWQRDDGTKTITINGAQIKGEWAYWNVFGTLTNSDGEEQIYEKRMGNGILRKYNNAEQLPIYEQTIGQYTGLKDKNGKKIFEGDIVKLTDKPFGYEWKAVVEFGNPNGNYTWGWQLKPIGKAKNVNTDILCWVEMEEAGAFCEVISNIHDTELIKENKQ